jgi:hypothetical protein
MELRKCRSLMRTTRSSRVTASNPTRLNYSKGCHCRTIAGSSQRKNLGRSSLRWSVHRCGGLSRRKIRSPQETNYLITVETGGDRVHLRKPPALPTLASAPTNPDLAPHRARPVRLTGSICDPPGSHTPHRQRQTRQRAAGRDIRPFLDCLIPPKIHPA